MHIQALLGGIIAILTPGVFILGFILMMALAKISNSKKELFKNVLFTGITIVVLYVFLGGYVVDLNLIDLDNPLIFSVFNYFILALNIIGALWLLGALQKVTLRIVPKRVSLVVMLVVFSLIFTTATLSNTNPILRSLLYFSPENSSIMYFYSLFLLFALGLTIPVCVMVFFASNKVRKVRENKSWKIMRIISGAYLIVTIALSYFIF